MLHSIGAFIQSEPFLETSWQDPRYFTRQRDLTFPTLIAFLLSGPRRAVQVELDALFALLSRRTRLSRVVTACAFSKARGHLRANVFDPLNDELLRLVDEHLPEAPRWLGLRVLAANASKVRPTLLDKEWRRGVRKATMASAPFRRRRQPSEIHAQPQPAWTRSTQTA